MRLLLDTHAIIWWLLGDRLLSRPAAAAIGDSDNRVYVSAASGWEIATKVRNGHLAVMEHEIASFIEDVEDEGLYHMPVEARHGIAGGLLEGGHKDPFDRLIAAQALLEGMVVVTRDRAFREFGCEVIW